jgi:transposase
MTKPSFLVPSIASGEFATMFVAFELSKASWQIGIVLPGSQTTSRFVVDGGDTGSVSALLRRKRLEAEKRCGRPVRIVSCYEAGYDGFWLHRWLGEQEVINHVLDAASIEVERRKRRVKTDRIDLDKLMRTLLALYRGEPQVCRVVRVPSPAEEDDKRRHRERDRLIKERGAHVNRIKALLHGQGLRDVKPLAKNFERRLSKLRTGDGRSLSPLLVAEIGRELLRLRPLVEQIAQLESETAAATRSAAAGSTAAKAAQLHRLVAIGMAGAQVLAHEVYYRSFANRRQVGSYIGLTGTPYDSGAKQREQGISKAGNRRARTMLIELAWLWARHQPDSALSRWFRQRLGETKSRRMRKVLIVALARRLAIALWRYLEIGLVPAGARLRTAPAI